MRTPISTGIVAVSVLFASLIACGGGDTPPPATPSTPTVDASAPSVTPPTASADAGAAATPVPEKPTPTADATKFDDLPKDKKVEIMAQKVVPNVGKDFKEFDGKRFATFGCATCHGPKKHEDPQKVLPKITLSGGGLEKMKKNKPEMFKFMSEKVVPDMAAALGAKAGEPGSQQGFSCKGCHEVK